MKTVEGRSRVLSGSEQGEINVEMFRVYLDSLRQSGDSLPMKNGEPNISAIAKATGLKRNVFYTNSVIARMLNEFIGRGEELTCSCGRRPPSTGQATKIQDLEQELLRAQQRLANCMVEREQLRAQIAEMEVKLTRFQVIEEEVIKGGRRLLP